MFDVLACALPAAFVVGAVVFFRRNRERVRERLKKVAGRRKGRIGKAPWFLYPRLLIPLEGAELQLSCLHGSRQGQSSRTFAWVGCEEYPELSLDVRRKPERAGMLERMGHAGADTGDRDFDAAFWVDGDDASGARALLDEELRRALLAFDPALRVMLRVGRTTAYRDGWLAHGEEELRLDVTIRGVVPEVENVERLVDAATLAHERLRASRTRRKSA